MNSKPGETATSQAIPLQASGENEVDLGALFRTLWRGKFWIIFACLTTFLIGGYFAFFIATPKYTANSVVMLESRQENVVDLDSVVSGLSGDQATINTEVEVIRARGLIEKLVEKLDLISDPEFNTGLLPEPRYSIKAFTDLFGKKFESQEPSEQAILDATINRVLGAISVSNLRQSYVLRITAVTHNAEKSALIANKLAELYILDQLEVKFRATEQATNWLSDRVAGLQISLEQSENAVKEFNSDTDLVSLKALESQNRQIKDLRERLATSSRTARATSQSIAALTAAKQSRDRAEMARLAQDAALNRLLNVINEQGSSAEPPFDARVDQIIERLKLDNERAESQEAALKDTVVDLEKRIERQSTDFLELQQLRREADANRLLYEYFLSRLKETSVQQGIQQADSRLLSAAAIPTSPSSPQKLMILLISLLGGLSIGAGIVLYREWVQTGVRTADELEKLTGYTVMGQIPNIPARRRKHVLKYLIEKPNSAATEAVRNLRTSTLLSNVDNPPKVIMSTSSLPGEGKTTQSLALAQNFAGLGRKVLLIEGDIRRRVFSQYFNIEESKGLLAVLSGEVGLSEVIVYNNDLQADVLISEKSSTNAADVFSSKKFETFLQDARKLYDVIIIDTPPVLVVADARVIGQSVDAILYTVKWDSTTRTQIREGLRMFETVNLKVTGLVLAQVDAKGMKRYGYAGEYGAYGGYGAKYYHN